MRRRPPPPPPPQAPSHLSLFFRRLKGAVSADCVFAPLRVMSTAHGVRCYFFNVYIIFCGQGNAGGLMPPLRQLLEQYTAYDLSSQPLMQLKIKALVLDLVHSMDVVDQLRK